MPPMVLALGELEHIYNKQNLKLRTNGSISFSSAQAHDISLTGGPQDLEALVSSRTWVAGGNRLQIRFHIFFDDIVVSESDTPDVIEHLGFALCNTQVWSQLSLQASLSLPGIDNDRSGSPNNVVLSLTSQPSSRADVKPPKGIPAAHLEAINLTFSFSTCRRRRVSPKAQQQSIESGDVHGTRGGEADLTHKKMDELSEIWSPAQGLPSVDSQGKCEGLPTLPPRTSMSSIDENEDDGALSQKHFAAMAPLDSRESSSSSDTLTSATIGPRSSHSNGSHRRHVPHEVDLEDTLKMVNASLYTMIFGRMPGPRGKSGGVVVSSDGGFPKLITLSPALFNPGYAQAILHCEIFHFTIAYTMTGIHRRTKSTTLRHRLDRLLNLAPDKYLEEDRIPYPSSGLSSLNLTDAINARLWLLTKSKMLDPFAGQKLKPLETSKRTSDEGITSNSMLEDALTGDGVDTPLFDTQHSDPSIDNQHTFIEEKVACGGSLFEKLGVLEADNSHDLLEEFPTFDEDNVTLFDDQDGELLFESHGTLTEEDVGHACITEAHHPDDGLLRYGQCLASRYPPNNYHLDHGDKEPPLDSRDEDLLLESQHELLDEGQGDWGSALDNLDLMETEDLEHDMLMDEDTLTEEDIADGDLFWKARHNEERMRSKGQGRCRSTMTWGVMEEYSHELLDASAKDILEGRHELPNDEVDNILDY